MKCPECGQLARENWTIAHVGPTRWPLEIHTYHCPDCRWVTVCDWAWFDDGAERAAKAKLLITIDLDNKQRPTANELAQSRYNDEVEYWIEFGYSDPPELLDGATWEIVEAQEAQS